MSLLQQNSFLLFGGLLLLLLWSNIVQGFVPNLMIHKKQQRVAFVGVLEPPSPLYAGGFEWEDPSKPINQGPENPFTNPRLMDGEGGLKTDPARLLAPRLAGCNVYLVGMMGTGKTVVGQTLARRMEQYRFIDTDHIIERLTNMSIPELFQSEGEESFRDIEGQVLNSVQAYVRCIVSTGGGMVEKIENWAKLHSGLVVWLQVEPDVIMERLEASSGTENRPLLQTENPLGTLQELLDKRIEKYNQADMKITVTRDMNVTQVVDAVVKELHFFIDENPPGWKAAKAKALAVAEENQNNNDGGKAP